MLYLDHSVRSRLHKKLAALEEFRIIPVVFETLVRKLMNTCLIEEKEECLVGRVVENPFPLADSGDEKVTEQPSFSL